MKTKRTSTKSVSAKKWLAIPVTVLTLALFSLNASGQKSETGMTDGAYQKVDVMPVYPGGDAELLKFVATNTTYPKEAKEKGIQGKVITRFKVKADGSVSDVSVLKGVNTSLDNEAIRVVSMLSNFTPGKLNGKPVAVWYTVPISFTLQ